MTDGETVLLSSIAYALGDPVPIDQCNDPTVLRHLDLLAEQGIRLCRISERTGAELAAEVANRTLTGHRGGSLGAVVYCTDTVGAGSVHDELWRFLGQVPAAASVPAFVVSGHECGNLGPALEVATGLLLGRGLQSVLLVTTDRASSTTRFRSSGVTVLSDGAASCLVTTAAPAPAFRILGSGVAVNATIDAVADRLRTARWAHAGIGRAVAQACSRAGIAPVACHYLVTANHGEAARAFLAMATGLPADRVFAPQVAEIAHCFGADALINLSLLAAGSIARPGQLALVLSTSPHSWSAAVVESLSE